jgi:hypothetical protein
MSYLYPYETGASEAPPTEAEMEAMYLRYLADEAALEGAAEWAKVVEDEKSLRPKRPPGCTCYDWELTLIGCECGALEGSPE